MKNFIFSLICFLLYAPYNNFYAQNKIVIIAQNSENLKINIGTGIDIKTEKKLNYNTNKTLDTFNIECLNYRKIYFRKDSSIQTFIGSRKDSLFLKISERKIQVYPLNRNLRKYDTTSIEDLYAANLNDQINKIEQLKKYLSEQVIIKKNISKNILSEKYKDYYLLEKSLCEKENYILKKILDKKLISKPNFEYNKSMNNYKLFKTLVDIYLKYNNTFFQNEILDKYFKSNKILNDEFLAYGYVNTLITDIILKGKKIQENPQTRYDFKKAYDILPSYTSGQILKYARFLCLKKIAEQKFLPDFEEYARNYLNSSQNKDMRNEVLILKDKYYSNYFSNSNFDSNNLKLLNIHQETTNLKKVLEKFNGNVIYIDFWASWCVPCRIQMPFSKKLQDEYKNKGVVFLFLSIDESFDKWKHACKKEKLERLRSNYISPNYSNSIFFKELDVSSIPRYMLFNKKGELIYRMAPGPGSRDIREILNKLLAE